MQASLFAIGQALAVLINVLGAALLVLELSGRTIAFPISARTGFAGPPPRSPQPE